MGALDAPVVWRGFRLRSGDVLALQPLGWRRLFRRARFAIVDVRDTSIPYVALRRKRRVFKLPLLALPAGRGAGVAVWRHPELDAARGGIVAARAAERMGEGIHHPSYDCGRESPSDAAFLQDAFAAAGASVRLEGAPGNERVVPLVRVQPEPPAAAEARGIEGPSGPTGTAGSDFVRRGIRKSLPWQIRGRR